MAKQLNVDMRFTADTSKAKQSINELQSAIQKLGYGTMPKDFGIDPAKFEQASTAARELAYHLNNAYNTKTGNLDLSKLNTSLKQSGTDLGKLTANFKDAGTVGQQAFVSLAKAIASADQPTISVNTHLQTMFTTLKNVARFQISSSIMHGLVGGIQSAYGYAQDLNESLNNIRIVTGQSTEQMARFAKQANEAARNLNATTLDYTNASLIYYQQGLNDSEVRERTDVTIKMANVARESAETVSEQLTAIWNNFDDGSKSLEYYADVITALGAATASSSSEISAGLNKFAAVADTVGLSYENATAALATITATTRQSADTVGTGLRTLFSRLQGLSLGETLEDGVNLNKYSKALQTVGVQALDASGNLRAMDDVLEDLGARWDTLSEAQQTALAQTVGGVRQYTTLVALMDNWDFMKQNQQVAAGAEGTLQEQADIYAESWEAARDRVKAATESLYDTLIDENFFIGVDNVIEHVLVGIDKFLEGFGGIKSLLISILSFTLSMTANKIGPAVQRIAQNIQIMTGGSQKVYETMQNQFSNVVNEELSSNKYDGVEKQELTNASQLLAVKTQLGRINESLTDSERMRAEVAIEGIEKQQQAIVKLINKEEDLKAAQRDIMTNLYAAQDKNSNAINKVRNKEIDKIYNENESEDSQYLEQRFNQLSSAADKAEAHLFAAQEKLLAGFMDGAQKISLTYQELFTMADGQQLFDFDQLNIQVETMQSTVEGKLLELKENFKDIIPDDLANSDNIIELIQQLEQLRNNIPVERLDEFNKMLDQLKIAGNDISTLKSQFKIWSESLGDIANQSNNVRIALKTIDGATSFTQLKKGLKNLEEAFKNSEISAEEYGKVLKMLKLPEKEINALISGEKTLSQVTDELKTKQDALNQSVQNFNVTHTIGAIEAITKTASSLGQIAMSINAIKSAFTALNDEDMSFGEKLTTVLTSASMLIPSLISSYSNLSNVINGLIGKMVLEGTITKEQTYKMITNQSIRELSKLGIDKENASLATSVILKNKDKFTTEALSTEKGKSTAITLLEAGAVDTDAASKIVATGATKGLAAANNALKLSMIEVIAIIAVLAVVIGGIILAYKAWQANTPEGKLKAANKELEEQKKKTEEAKKAWEDLNSTISDYKSAYDALSNLKEGTAEFSEQVLKTNEAARELIKTLRLVAGIDYEIGSNGEYIIHTDSESFQKKQEEKYNNKTQVETAEMLAQWAADDAQTNVDKSDFINKYGTAGGQVIVDNSIDAEAERDEYIAKRVNEIIEREALSTDMSAPGAYFALQQRAQIEAQNDWAALQSDVDMQNEYARLFSDDADNIAQQNKLADLRDQMGANLFYNDDYQAAQQNGLALAALNSITTDDVVGLQNGSTTIEDIQNRVAEQAKVLNAQLNSVDKDNRDLAKAAMTGEDAQTGVANYLKTLNLSDIQKFIDEGIFWEDLGFSSNDLGSLQDILDESIRGWTPPPFDLSSITTEISNVQKITDKLTTGSNISLEDYTTLYDSIGEAAEGYFTRMADGTYILTGDAEEFLRIVKENQIEKLMGAQQTQSDVENKWNETSPGQFGITLDTAAERAKKLIDSEEVGERDIGVSSSFVDTMLGSDTWTSANGDIEQQTALLQEAINKYQELQNSVNDAEMAVTTMATSVGDLQNIDAKYALTQKAVNEGYKVLATQTEEGKIALAKYSQEMEGLDENSAEALKVTENFQKTIKDIQATNAAKAIKELNVNLDNLSENDAEQVAEQLQTVFGDSVTADWIQNHKELVKQWLTGTEEQRQAAANQIDNYTALGQIINQFDKDSIKSQAGLEALTGQLEANANAAQLFASNFTNLKELLTNGFTELNGIRFNIDGSADMSSAIQSMIEAGKTAQEVATYIQEAGLSHVQFSMRGTPIPDQPDFEDTDAWIEWYNNNIADMEPSEITGTGEWSANAGIPNMTSLGSGGGGGGGGSKSSAKTHTKKEKDSGSRYHTIQQKQSDNERRLEEAADRAERGYGKIRIDNLKQQIQLQQQAVDLQKQYLQEINNYLASDKEALTDFFARDLAGIASAPIFDPTSGIITNYQQIEDQLLNWYNSQAEKEMDEDAWKAVEEKYNNAMDKIKQYEETLDLSKEQMQELINKNNELADQMLEMAQYKVEIKVELDDNDLELLDHMLNRIDDDAYQAAEAIALLGDKTGVLLDKQQIYNNGINEILSNHGVTLDQAANMTPDQLQQLGFTDAEKEALSEYRSELLDINADLEDMQDTIQNKVIDSFNELNDKVSESYDFFSHYNDVLESYRNIADLNHAAIGKEARVLIKNLDDSMLKNQQNTLKSSKYMYDQLVKDREIAEEKLQGAIDAGIIGDEEKYREVLENIDSQIRDAQETWLQNWEDGLQQAQDILTRAVEDAVAEYEELLAPMYNSLDFLQESYDMRNEVDEDYVQDYEKLYQLNKLNRELEKTFNETDGLKNRQSLKKLQEQINKLQKDGTKMSEYDLEVLRKKFEVEQARIALEESQSAKNTVKLQRDREGNWGYAFVADSDSLDNAQQNYEDKLYEYQKLNDDYMKEMSDQILSLSSQARDKLAEIWSDATLSEEEKKAKVAEVELWFNSQTDFINQQMTNALDNQESLTERFYNTYENLNAKVRDTFKETILAQTTQAESLNGWISLLSDGFDMLNEKGSQASLEYQSNLDTINELAGSNTGALISDTGKAENEIDIASEKNVGTIQQLSDTIQDELSMALESAILWEKDYAKAIEESTNRILDQAAAINSLIRQSSDLNDALTGINAVESYKNAQNTFGIQQPSYNKNDWIANRNIDEIFQSQSEDDKNITSNLTDAGMNALLNYLPAMLTALGVNANIASQGFGSMISPGSIQPILDTIEQNVHIEASFPNVSSSSEIEDAFENLVNKASQYAHRKRQG